MKNLTDQLRVYLSDRKFHISFPEENKLIINSLIKPYPSPGSTEVHLRDIFL
jgi:hypothetical protein